MLNFGIFDWVEASATLAPAEVYAHKLELAAAADAAGFHGMFVAEHHGMKLHWGHCTGVRSCITIL